MKFFTNPNSCYRFQMQTSVKAGNIERIVWYLAGKKITQLKFTNK